MAKFMLDGQEYCGGGSQIVELTQAEYDALPDTKKTDNILYAITDCDELSAENMAFDDTETQLGVNNVQDAIVEQNKNLNNFIILVNKSVDVINENYVYIDYSDIEGYRLLSVSAIDINTTYLTKITKIIPTMNDRVLITFDSLITTAVGAQILMIKE